MLKAKNINKWFHEVGHDDEDEMNDALAWACHHMCFSLCQWMNALLRHFLWTGLSSKAQIYHRQYFHQKHKYIIVNIVIKSTNIIANIVSSVEWKTRKQLYESCSSCSISGPHLFKLNQKLALIMNLLALWSEDRKTLWNWQTFIFSNFKTWLTNAIGFLFRTTQKN